MSTDTIQDRQYEALMEALADGVLVLGEDSEILYANPAAAELFGRGVEELMGAAFGHPAVSGEHSVIHSVGADGTLRHVELRAVDTIWRGRSCRLATLRDITERVEAQEALRQSELRYKNIFNVSADAIYLHGITPAGELRPFVEANDVACERLGYTREELSNMTIADIDAPELADRVADVVAKLRDRGRALFEMVHVAKDGTRIPVEIHARTFEYQGELAVAAAARDIRDRKAAERELKAKEKDLQRAQKLEAVGRLAGGVAHDFNNMLAVIQGYSEIALASLPPEDPLAADLEEIRRAATRSETIVSQLMAFSREQRLNPEVIDVDAAIGEMRRMLASLLGEDIDFELDLGSGVWKTKIDRGRFEQIMANLAINARDAMAGGGRLTIATGTVSLDGGDFVVISVEDTGCGMDEETVSHIFEPFYTTKERGKGTGLGLATVYGFVQQSGGRIEVQSEPGRGTTFTICLPRHTADDPALVEDEGLTSRRGGSGAAGATVLVVEDEKMIREMAARVLGEELKVLTASNGREAIEVFRKHEGRIDLLIADVVMPGMNGPEAAAVMKKSHPELAVLYMSGYSDEDKELGVRMEKGDGLLRKPFSLEELEDAVHRALANQREA